MLFLAKSCVTGCCGNVEHAQLKQSVCPPLGCTGRSCVIPAYNQNDYIRLTDLPLRCGDESLNRPLCNVQHLAYPQSYAGSSLTWLPCILPTGVLNATPCQLDMCGLELRLQWILYKAASAIATHVSTAQREINSRRVDLAASAAGYDQALAFAFSGRCRRMHGHAGSVRFVFRGCCR